VCDWLLVKDSSDGGSATDLSVPQIMKKREDLRLIVSSATLDAEVHRTFPIKPLVASFLGHNSLIPGPQ